MPQLNYNHLHYFWVVAREGSIARAADLLFVTPQTISGQLRTLEHTVGAKLFRKSGRGLVLSQTGELVYQYADEMFRLGSELTSVLQDAEPTGPRILKVGIAEVVPKLITYRLLRPALTLDDPLRIVCSEGRLHSLLGDLAVHRLDLVIADSPVSPNLNVRAFNHLLGECGLCFFAAASDEHPYERSFPGSLDGAPMLVPSELSMVRRGLEQWFERYGVRPRVVGEFDDSALMKAFGQGGVGVFAAPSAIEHEVRQQYGVRVIGRTDEIRERFYAISAERKIKHPAVLAISDVARSTLFAGDGAGSGE